MTKAKNAGIIAYHDGVARTQNPYAMGSVRPGTAPDEAAAWYAGYDAAAERHALLARGLEPND